MAEEIIANVATEEITKAVAEEAIEQGSVKLPSGISINGKAVAAGAGIAVGIIGLAFGAYKLVKYLQKNHENKKGA